jgi:hypothetical protein
MVLALLRTCCEPLPAKLWYPLMLRHQWLGYGKRSKQVPRSPKQPSLSIAWLLGICRVKPSSHHLKHCKKYFLLARQQCNKNYLGQSLTLPGPKMSQVLNIAGKWLGWSKCHHRTMSYQECSFWQKKIGAGLLHHFHHGKYAQNGHDGHAVYLSWLGRKKRFTPVVSSNKPSEKTQPDSLRKIIPKYQEYMTTTWFVCIILFACVCSCDSVCVMLRINCIHNNHLSYYILSSYPCPLSISLSLSLCFSVSLSLSIIIYQFYIILYPRVSSYIPWC